MSDEFEVDLPGDEKGQVRAEEVPAPEEIAALPLQIAAALIEDEIPPKPPLEAPPGGPSPPADLPFDFAWERQVVPASASDREREQIRDTAGFVPLPLSREAIAEWSKSVAIWRGQPLLNQYLYLLKKGHIGAMEHLYPRHLPQDYCDLLLRHGFTDEQAAKAFVRRERAEAARATAYADPAVQELVAQEERHAGIKDAFSKAFVEKQKKEKR